MQLLGILIELRGEGAANAGIYRHTWRSRASSIFVIHAPYKVTLSRLLKDETAHQEP